MEYLANTPTALVVGAHGRFGRVVAGEFARRGWRVRGLVRHGGAGGDAVLPATVDVTGGDARSAHDMIAAADGADVIVNAANPAYRNWDPAVLEIAEAVIAAARTSGAVHLFPGNVYNYGWPMPELLSEMTAQRPSTRKGSIRVEAERRFREAADVHGVRTIVLRAGDLYGGTGRGSWFDLVVAEHLSSGRMTYPGPLNVPHAWAYLPDLAATFEALARRRGEFDAFEAFHFPGHTVTGEDMAAAFEAALGRPVRSNRMPWWVVRLGAPFVRDWREISEMAYLWHVPHRLDGAKLEMALGDIPTTSFERAVSDSLAALGFETRPMEPSARSLVPV
ncbi:NAD-dependent epimerase/dehydratase family protein [Microbaculum marinum]|uniref:NAD(P)H-binding protein n=1 Tax=Microbaculum marinum TaxID=1764581 RepID=A0AAW9RN02_9HYPH